MKEVRSRYPIIWLEDRCWWNLDGSCLFFSLADLFGNSIGRRGFLSVAQSERRLSRNRLIGRVGLGKNYTLASEAIWGNTFSDSGRIARVGFGSSTFAFSRVNHCGIETSSTGNRDHTLDWHKIQGAWFMSLIAPNHRPFRKFPPVKLVDVARHSED